MKKHKNNEWIMVGKIGRPHGLKGFVTIQSFTEPATNIVNYSPWYDKNGQPISLVECKRLGTKVIALFDELSKGKTQTHETLWIKRSQLPALKKDEYYWADLIGLRVYNLEKKYLGDVKELFSTGANDVVVVKDEQSAKTMLIPYVLHHTIIEVDLNEGVMRVDWHEI